ncbi:MAG: iron-containing alcohol dehydrogenase, partial [Clostridiales bacterium]|nr:iron-containing alcohol dehydrogenase [Clostridiales bacterium]
DEETLENFISAIETLKEKTGIKKTIAEYGVDESKFLETLDEMTEMAFDDQCTGANPRYPLFAEIKQIYLKAYYGKEVSQ